MTIKVLGSGIANNVYLIGTLTDPALFPKVSVVKLVPLSVADNTSFSSIQAYITTKGEIRYVSNSAFSATKYMRLVFEWDCT